jgi:hypothetical protein
MGLIGAFVACATIGVALAAPKPLPLSARVIQAGEFSGGSVAFKLGPPKLAHGSQPPSRACLQLCPRGIYLYTTAKQWGRLLGQGLTRAQASAQIARLRAEGFVGAAARNLSTPVPEPWIGLSWAMQLRSAAAATAELDAEVRDLENAKLPATYAAFAVSGIPAARGYRLGSPSGAGDNVQFADGPFVYLVGEGWFGNPKNRPTRANLIAAATRLYERVHGHPPA